MIGDTGALRSGLAMREKMLDEPECLLLVDLPRKALAFLDPTISDLLSQRFSSTTHCGSTETMYL